MTLRLAQATRLCAFALLTCAAIPPATAQSFMDLIPKKMLPNTGQLRDVQRKIEEGMADGRCKELVDWAGSAEASAQGSPSAFDPRARRASAAATTELDPNLRLFTDELFKPVFGKAFDDLSASQRLEIYNETFVACQRNRTYGNAVRSFTPTLGAPFQDVNAGSPMARPRPGSMTAAQVSDAIKKMRNAGSRSQSVLAELQSLPDAPASWNTFLARKPEADDAIRYLPASERQRAQTSLQQTGARLASSAIASTVESALAAAEGSDGLSRLRAATSQLSVFEGFANPGELSSARSTLQQRRDGLVKVAVAADRERLHAIGPGAANLPLSATWYQDVQRRHDNDARQHPDFQLLMSEFRSKRDQQLAAAQPTLAARINGASSAAELNTALSGALSVPGDSESSAGRDLRQRAQAREESLYKAQVLGSQAQERPVMPEVAAARQENAAPSSRPGSREPTASEMYDLIQSKFNSIAENVKETQQDCSRGANPNDPVRSILCLGNIFQSAAGAGEPMKITKFEKLGCERASGKPGYVCDYLLAYTGGATGAAGPTMAALVGRGGAAQGRFLKTSDGWVVFFNEN